MDARIDVPPLAAPSEVAVGERDAAADRMPDLPVVRIHDVTRRGVSAINARTLLNIRMTVNGDGNINPRSLKRQRWCRVEVRKRTTNKVDK